MTTETAKAYNTCFAPEAAYRSCRGAVHVTDRAGVEPIGRRLSLLRHSVCATAAVAAVHRMTLLSFHIFQFFNEWCYAGALGRVRKWYGSGSTNQKLAKDVKEGISEKGCPSLEPIPGDLWERREPSPPAES